MVGEVVEPLISLTDLAIVGNMKNGNTLSAVAAVGIAGSLLSTLIWVFAQMKSAVSAVVSQAFGGNRMKETETLIPQMIGFNLLIGTAAAILTYWSSPWIFESLLSASGDVLRDAVAYYNIRVIGFPLTLITFSIYGVFRGIQNTWWAMMISIIGGSLNVVLDLIFVLGWGGWTETMGVQGAAWASVISQAVMFLLTLYFLIVRSGLKMRLSSQRNMHFKPMLLIAWNLILRTLVLNIALLLTHKFSNMYGTAQAATNSLILNLWLFTAFFMDGFSTSANALAGKYLGSADVLAMRLNVRRNLLMNFIVSCLLATILMFFGDDIISILIKDDEVKMYYPLILPLFALCLPVNSVAFTYDGVFKGMGEAKFLRNLLVVSTLLGFIPVLWIGHYLQPGIQIIWIAMIVWMLYRAIIPYFYFQKWMVRFEENNN